MEINGSNPGFKISARGLSVQRTRMNLIAENIANAETTRTENGEPFKRKFITISQNEKVSNGLSQAQSTLKMQTTNGDHIPFVSPSSSMSGGSNSGLDYQVNEDTSQGELIFMPNHPDANEDGYVQSSNINVIQEMVEMIAASRSYEANLTALDTSKQIAKDSLEI
ncbi:MAG: flagellar basal body rod protein FlgC [Bacteroidetes bacterium]|nr:flagellar basal body rod protein FlgC [Bacteroidota bacterium]MBU1115158.1 flagellar basal body rod protein FlgC [Bacteroidota bacterium]MBU1799329.1 flagellar basal body rod protein FlgC [Bacteroidota bacterium]